VHKKLADVMYLHESCQMLRGSACSSLEDRFKVWERQWAFSFHCRFVVFPCRNLSCGFSLLEAQGVRVPVTHPGGCVTLRLCWVLNL